MDALGPCLLRLEPRSVWLVGNGSRMIVKSSIMATRLDSANKVDIRRTTIRRHLQDLDDDDAKSTIQGTNVIDR